MIRHFLTLTGFFLLVLATFAAVASAQPTSAPLIARQPVYREARQQYLLLLLGQNPQQKIWVVRDGSAVYVDRNGNGDLTEAGEKVIQPDTNESASYVRLGMIRDAHGQEHGPLECRIPTRGGGNTGQVRLKIAKKFEQEANFVPLGQTPEAACHLHFDGPLTASFLGYRDSRPVPTHDPKFLTLTRRKPRLLQAWVGTQVKNFPAVSCVTFSVTGENQDKRPRLKIVFENRASRESPIVKAYVLQEETRTIFSERVQAPANSGSRAKLTLTFSPPVNIPPYAIEVKVQD